MITLTVLKLISIIILTILVIHVIDSLIFVRRLQNQIIKRDLSYSNNLTDDSINLILSKLESILKSQTEQFEFKMSNYLLYNNTLLSSIKDLCVKYNWSATAIRDWSAESVNLVFIYKNE